MSEIKALQFGSIIINIHEIFYDMKRTSKAIYFLIKDQS